MGEDRTRGDNAATNRDDAAASGWVTTRVAARSLGVSPRTVRWHIEQGNLEAKPQGEGVRRAWLVSIDSVHTLRDARRRERGLPGDHRAATEDADIIAESSGNAIRELADRLVEEASRASEFRVRLELSEQAESTLREELAEERRRREEAERELAALMQARENPETVEEAPERSEHRPATGGAQEGAQRPWWRRVLRR